MSAIPPIVPLLAEGAAVVTAGAAVLAVRRLRRDLAAARSASGPFAGPAAVPGARAAASGCARHADCPECAAGLEERIRAAVAAALADERERELAEARAFWAAYEVHRVDAGQVTDPAGPANAPGPGDTSGESAGGARTTRPAPHDRLAHHADPLPRDQSAHPGHPGAGAGPAGGADPRPPAAAPDADPPPPVAIPPLLPRQVDRVEPGPELPRPRYHHPSDPDFRPAPAVADPGRTAARLAELAEARTPLADVRPGPMGTLDLYLFADGSSLCLAPGHSETTGRLTAALERGETPVLMGGSGISGAYALTFTFGTESVYVLADRVVASL